MIREEEIFTKCCGCVPLRICLQIYAWIKVAADISASVVLLLGLVFFNYQNPERLSNLSVDHLYMVIILALVVDLFFMVILIGGVCYKNLSSLRVFFYYGMSMIVTEAIIITTVVIISISRYTIQWWSLMLLTIFILAGITWICIDISIIRTVKSEMIKISNNDQYDFLRLPVPKVYEENRRLDENIETYKTIGQDFNI